jgi:16S rRNA processing protein RimM
MIGRLVGAHGIGGGLKLKSYAESLDIFAPGRRLLAVDARGGEREVVVAGVRPQGRGAWIALKGVADRGQAAALVGSDLFIDRAELPALEAGAFYWADLIGIEVHAAAGGYLGRIASIFRTGSNDVYVVAEAGRELLIPALAAVIARVDLAAGRMEVNLPEGLEWT